MDNRAAEKIKFMLISPEGVHFSGDVNSVELPGKSSAFTVLPHHVNLVAQLQAGMAQAYTDSGLKTFLIDGGFAEVVDNKVSAVVSGIVDVHSINIDAEKAQLHSLISRVIPPEDRDFAEENIQIHRARIQNAEKK